MKPTLVSSWGRWAGIISVSAMPVLAHAQSLVPPPAATPPAAPTPAGSVATASVAPSATPVPAPAYPSPVAPPPVALAQNYISDPTGQPSLALPAANSPFEWQQGGPQSMNPFGQAAKPASPVVVNFGQINTERQEQIGEDLEVMSLLVEKKLEQSFGSMTTIHLGIPMLVRHGAPPVQSMFLEGYGAIFMIHVNFPLVGAPEPPKTKTEEPKNSEWESIRSQLHGEPGAGNNFQYVPDGYQTTPTHHGFSQERVEAVEDQLIRSLKYASNIRGLSPQDFVVLSVRGTGSNGVRVRSVTASSSAGGQNMLGTIGGSGGGGGFSGSSAIVELAGEAETFLSLRAKKADINAFASGEMKFEDFKAQVAKASYRGGKQPAAR